MTVHYRNTGVIRAYRTLVEEIRRDPLLMGEPGPELDEVTDRAHEAMISAGQLESDWIEHWRAREDARRGITSTRERAA